MTQPQRGRLYWIADDVLMFGWGVVLLILFALLLLWLVAEATVFWLRRAVFPHATAPPSQHSEAEKHAGRCDQVEPR